LASLLERATIGFFLLFAAIHFRSSEAKGFAGAIRVIQQQPYGSALLAITAAGLLAFGLYGFAEAAFRRITPQAVHLKANLSAAANGERQPAAE
jgi:sulfite exporter TauE/SafE